MRIRAIKDLSQLPDAELFEEIATGAELCAANARQIQLDSLKLDELNRTAGAKILRLAAEEEAAKVLILIDAVRCPRNEMPNDFARHLQYFNDHLAKGIYARYMCRRPHIFSDVREWVDRERKEYYLDGPNDVDWIFYNEILRSREETIYVDYVENDGTHLWHDPRRLDDLGANLPIATSPSLTIVSALSDAGFFTAGALRVVASTWRNQVVDDALTTFAMFDINNQTLENLYNANLLATSEPDILDEIANGWLFPLYGLDLRKHSVSKDGLREIQRNWMPYGYDQ